MKLVGIKGGRSHKWVTVAIIDPKPGSGTKSKVSIPFLRVHIVSRSTYHLPVNAVVLNKLSMRSFLDHLAFIKNKDDISILNG